MIQKKIKKVPTQYGNLSAVVTVRIHGQPHDVMHDDTDTSMVGGDMIMTARGWQPIRFAKNNIGQPSYEVPCTEADIFEKKVDNFRWRGQINGEAATYVTTKIGEIPRGANPDADKVSQQFIRAFQDYREGKLDYTEFKNRYSSNDYHPEWNT